MRLFVLTALAAISFAQPSFAQRSAYDGMISSHAAANGVPEALVHRVIVRESRYRADAVGRGGATGLMQIKLATARGLGYTGTAAGLRDPNTNLTYAVKYLAGAYRVANGNSNLAVSHYARGYYYAAKRQGLSPVVVKRERPSPLTANAQQVEENTAINPTPPASKLLRR